MDYRYHILTNIRFRHTYFADGLYRGFTAEPDAETRHHLQRLAILFKPVPGGFTLLYETAPGRERNRADVLKENLVLGFVINNTDPGLMNYTEGLPADIADTILYFRNDVQAAGNGLLHKSDYFSEGETLQNKPPDAANPHNRSFFAKPFAWMEIALHPSLEEALHVQFKGRETVWRYILSSPHLQDLADPAVIHKDTKDPFKGPVYIVLPGGEKKMAFESVQRIPLSSRAEKIFQLVENFQPGSSRYKVVMSILPNPDISAISSVQDPEGRDAAVFSEIFI